MAYVDLTSDDEKIQARHNVFNNKVTIRLGYLGAVVLRDEDEARELIEQLQAALAAQAEHQERELLRNEDEVRAAAEIREAL